MFEFFVAGSVSGVVASLNIGFPRHRRITKPQAFTALPDNCPPPSSPPWKLKKAEATPSPHPHCRVVGRMWGVLFRSENDKIWLLPWMGGRASPPTDFGSRSKAPIQILTILAKLLLNTSLAVTSKIIPFQASFPSKIFSFYIFCLHIYPLVSMSQAQLTNQS